MITGRMYWRGGKENIREKILWLQKVYALKRTKGIKAVAIKRSDGEAEGLCSGDYVGKLKIILSDDVLSDHFWFIMENNRRIYPKFVKTEK